MDWGGWAELHPTGDCTDPDFSGVQGCSREDGGLSVVEDGVSRGRYESQLLLMTRSHVESKKPCTEVEGE